MDIARLNQRIVIQKKVTERNDAGVSTSHWDAEYLCWSTISGESGNLDSGEGMEKAAELVSFTIRYCTPVLAIAPLTHRVLYKGQPYDILAVDHNFYRGIWIKLICQKVRSSNVR